MYTALCKINASVAKLAFTSVLAVSVYGIMANSANSQDASTPQNDASLSELLAGGFQIQAMQYLPRSMVFTLQNGAEAYVCETDLDGQNTICVALE